MHISYALYRAFWTGGFLADTIKKLNITHNVSMGDFVKLFYQTFLTNDKVSGNFLAELNNKINTTFDEYIDPANDSTKMLFTTDYITNADPVRLITLTIFLKLDNFKEELTAWIHRTWPSLSVAEIDKDINCTITYNNFRTKPGLFFKKYYYHDIFEDKTDPAEIEHTLSVYLSSSVPVPPIHFLRAKTVIF
jgi:hypothetical protein